MNVADILDWYEDPFIVRLAAHDVRALWTCKACGALVAGAYRAAHRAWHLELEATR